MFYREDRQGQVLQEGINEAGAFSSWIAAATSYSNHDVQMVPFYVFYSMFGFQRIGDLAWAAGDSRARGFLVGGTAGRTTLNGEGLQHEDGHSHLLASTIPNCVSYDPAYAYELAVIVHEGLRRMIAEQEDVFYYLTVMNENYPHPALPEGAEEGILRGMHRIRESKRRRCSLLGSGTILREVEAAADLLATDFGVAADVWSVTSWTELRRDGLRHDRDARLRPDAEPEAPWVDALPSGKRCARGRGNRLHEGAPRRRPCLGPGAVRRAGHRRLRPQRLPAPPAGLLRGRPPPRRCRRPARARGRGRGQGRRSPRTRSSATRSTPTLRTRRCRDGRAAARSRSPTSATSSEVPVIEILVKPGDEVGADAPLVTLESDKATMDVPRRIAGRSSS